MFNAKFYELSLVKDYVSHWGLAEAARELIQNALDSSSPFLYSFEPMDYSPNPEEPTEEHQGWSFHLKSENSRLEPHHLLLGSTGKAQDASAIGSFGEGFKIALLVLTRMGYPVIIFNNERTWRPRFRYNKAFGAEVLCVEEELGSKHHGLEFIVCGISDADRATIEACCLKMQSDIGQIIPTTMGDILLDRPGELYVGSLFVCKNEMKFGYNVKPEHITLERDRQTVSSWDLGCITRDMWYDTKRADEIAQMIFDDIPDMKYAQYSAPELIKAAVYEHFKREHPGAIVAESPSELKQMIERGLTKTVYIGGGPATILKSNFNYREDTAHLTRVQTPGEYLLSWFNAHKQGMSAMNRKHFEEQVLNEAKKWLAR